MGYRYIEAENKFREKRREAEHFEPSETRAYHCCGGHIQLIQGFRWVLGDLPLPPPIDSTRVRKTPQKWVRPAEKEKEPAQALRPLSPTRSKKLFALVGLSSTWLRFCCNALFQWDSHQKSKFATSTNNPGYTRTHENHAAWQIEATRFSAVHFKQLSTSRTSVSAVACQH